MKRWALAIAVVNFSLGMMSGGAHGAPPTAHWSAPDGWGGMWGGEVEVVAAHPSGIASVEFSHPGEVRVIVRNGVPRYASTLVGTEQGAQVTATITANSGEVRTLEPMTLWAPPPNGGARVFVSPEGSDETGTGTPANPFATIYMAARQAEKQQVALGEDWGASGSTILLMAGDYSWAGKEDLEPPVQTRRGWLTIVGAGWGGGARITGNRSKLSGLMESDVRFIGVQFTGYPPVAKNSRMWFDRCTFVGQGPEDNSNFARNDYYTKTFFTGCVFQNYRNGPTGATLMDGCDLLDIGSDAFHQFHCVLGCAVDGIRKPPGSSAHPDFAQLFVPNSPIDNRLMWGVRAKNINAQGLFMRGDAEENDTSIAFIDVRIWCVNPGYKSQLMRSVDGFIMDRVMILGQEFTIRNESAERRTVLRGVIRDCVFQAAALDPGSIADMKIDRCHFFQGDTAGAYSTGGLGGLEAVGDVNEDGVVDFDDLTTVLRYWLRNYR